MAAFSKGVLAFAYSAVYCICLGVEIQANVPRERVLVLANGQVIEGIIALDGEYYKVILPKGKLQVRIDQVEFLCENKEEAYVRRRARRIATTATAEAHLEMARWCVQNDLLAYAAVETAAARKVDPKHRLISSVDRQLKQARELYHQNAQSANVVGDGLVMAASAELESTAQELRDVPVWARTEFIKRIQPMLAQSCATAGCHLPNSSQELRIDRLALDGVGNPDLIHRNLASTVSMLDFAFPEESRLLTKGAAVHGSQGRQSHPLTPHQHEILRAWASQLALNEPPNETAEETPVRQVVVGMHVGPQKNLVHGATGTVTSPDPFDPAEFNQIQKDANLPRTLDATRPAQEDPQAEPAE